MRLRLNRYLKTFLTKDKAMHVPAHPLGESTICLADLHIGEEATIVGYDRIHAHYLTRLLAMGLTRGSRILVVRKAPLGDPVDIRLRGYHLSLRRDEASVLLLERLK